MNELAAVRAPRGKAELKKTLLKEIDELDRMSWHLVILATGNENSTYDGNYPETIAVARDKHLALLKEKKENFLKEMQK